MKFVDSLVAKYRVACVLPFVLFSPRRRRQMKRARAAAVEGSRQARILNPQEFAK
jgi:hypothetical protein